MYTEVRECPSCLVAVKSISFRKSMIALQCRECSSLKISKFGQILKAIGLWQRNRSSKHRHEPKAKAKTDIVAPNSHQDNVSKIRNGDSKSRPTIKDVNKAWVSTQGLNDIYCKWTQMRRENDPHHAASLGTDDQQMSPKEGEDVTLNRVSSNYSRSLSLPCCSSPGIVDDAPVVRSRCRSVHWADDTGSRLETVHHFQKRCSFLRTFKACLRSSAVA